MTSSAPRTRSFSDLVLAARGGQITRAPAILANCRANVETPPVPRVSTVFARFQAARNEERIPCRNRRAGQGGGFFEREMLRHCHQPFGVQAAPARRASRRSRRPAPNAICASLGAGPSSQVCMKIPATRSPGLTRVTPGPTAVTSPAPSDRGISGGFTFAP